VFLALKGEFGAAEAAIMDGLAMKSPNHPSHHHDTYDAACVYALAGDSSEAVKWLRVTASTGFPNYPLFTRDHYLDRIRRTPEFVQFLSDQKARWEELRQEFEN
jgi:hypothetical protein